MNEQEIFAAALEYDVDRRAAFLTEACGTDAEMRRRIEILLNRHKQAGEFFDKPAGEILATAEMPPITEKPGTQIGPYKLLQQVGEGGMGVVYMAEQKKPVKRRIALKIIKPGMDTREVIARFEAERQALAMMDHPNIAKVLDCGTTQTGRPYFVMELVKGVSITKYCDANHLSPKERLELFIPVCQAIQHAHQKGIIHRDIKPSNILIAEYDHKAVPKIIDFGVAKALNQQLTSKTMFTQLGQIIGTIEYMSPEQAKVNQLDVDTRSDIYSLGVLLYELLSGSTPFDRKRLRSVAIDELMRIIREEDPPRPSTRLSTVETLPSIAANRKTEPKKLSVLLHGELDWIVMKAMEKDRGRRYDSASAFADDIQNYLNDDAVLACPPSAGYRFRKLARRHKVGLITGGIVAAALILGMIGTSWQAVRASKSAQRERDANQLTQESLAAEQQARREAEQASLEENRQRELAVAAQQAAEKERDRAETEAIRANTVVDVLKELFDSSNKSSVAAKPVNFTMREFLLNRVDRLPERLKDQPEVEAEVRAIIGRALTSASGPLQLFKAKEQLELALQIRREKYGDLHAKSIDSILDLAEFYRKTGFRSKRREHEVNAFELSRQLVNAAPEERDNVNVRLRSYFNTILVSTYQKRIPLCSEAIELARKNSVNDNPYLARILRCLAAAKWTEHRVAQVVGPSEHAANMGAVMSYAEHALAENSTIFGREHPRTAHCLSLLGTLELANANRDGAERFFFEAFNIHKKYSSAAYFRLSNLEKVLPIDEFDKLVDQNFLSGGGFYLYARAIAQYEKGNQLEYQRTVARIIENYDDAGLGPWYLAQACSMSPDAVDDWSPVIERIRNSKPNSTFDESERLGMLGNVLLRAGQTREAADLLTAILDEWEPLRATLWENSFVLTDIWHHELMLALALSAEDNSEEARRRFFKVATEAPRLLIGQEFGAGQNLTRKLKLLLDETQALLQISPDSFPVDSHNPWSYVARGQLFESAGQAEQAIADFRRAIELKPDCWQLYRLRAETLRNSGMLESAIADYTKAIELNPGDNYHEGDNSHQYFEVGEILLQLEKYEMASDFLEKAIKLAPNETHYYKRAALAHFHLGQFDEAIEDLRVRIEASPEDTSTLWWINPDLVSQCPDGEFKNGLLQLADNLIETTKNKGEALVCRARLHFAMNQIADGEADLTKALELEPDNASVWDQHGEMYARLGRWDEATTDFERAIELASGLWTPPYHLALAQVRSGDLTGYRTTCQAMIDAFTETEDSLEANFVAWTCAVGADALEDWTAARKLARMATAQSDSMQNKNTLGTLLMRSGETDESIKVLTDLAEQFGNPSKPVNFSPAYTWYALALAHHDAGQVDEAKQWFEKANRWTEKVFAEDESQNGAKLAWNRRLTLQLLRDQASAILNDASKSSLEKNNNNQHQSTDSEK